MRSLESYNKWIEIGYRYFAEQGPQNFSIMALAEQCQLPRTNFYYYFDDKEDLIDKLIELHFKTTAELFNKELNKRFHSYIPDLYVILYDFELGLKFTYQLFKNRELPKYNNAHKKGIALSFELILPKFKTFFKLDLPDETIISLWDTLTDSWYSRLNIDDLSVEAMTALCYEIMDTILPLVDKEGEHLE